MPKVRMTEGPMAGKVVNFVHDAEAAEVLDRGFGVPVFDEPEDTKPQKSTRAKRVKAKRKAERAVLPTETPEG